MLTHDPLISIIMPTHDRLPFLRIAIGSVLAQTYTNWELIVVDDGSTDGTDEFLAAGADPRLQPLFITHLGNPAAVRNIGADRARGRFLAFLDSDDLWAVNKLARQVAAMRADPESRWSYTNFATIDADGVEIERPAGAPWVPHSGWILERLLRDQAAVVTPTVMVEQTLFSGVGGFDVRLLFSHDYDLWLRLASHARVRAVDEILVHTRHHQGRRTSGRIEVHEWKVAVFTKLAASTDDRQIRQTCRQRSAEHLLALARHHSAKRRHGQALQAIGRAWRYEPVALRWWSALVRACARAVLPTSLVDRYRRRRRGASRPTAPPRVP